MVEKAWRMLAGKGGGGRLSIKPYQQMQNNSIGQYYLEIRKPHPSVRAVLTILYLNCSGIGGELILSAKKVTLSARFSKPALKECLL